MCYSGKRGSERLADLATAEAPQPRCAYHDPAVPQCQWWRGKRHGTQDAQSGHQGTQWWKHCCADG